MSSLCRHLKRSGVVLRFRLDISWSLMLWLFSGVTANQRGRVTPYVTASGYGCGVWRPVGRGSGSVCWPASRFAVFWSCWSQCYLRVRFGCFSLVSILEENVLRRLSLLWITRAGSGWLSSFVRLSLVGAVLADSSVVFCFVEVEWEVNVVARASCCCCHHTPSSLLLLVAVSSPPLQRHFSRAECKVIIFDFPPKVCVSQNFVGWTVPK